MSSAKEASKVSQFWATREPNEANGGFYVSRFFRPYIIDAVFGPKWVETHRNNQFYPVDIFIEEFLQDRPIKSVLSLCCGLGSIERHFVERRSDVEDCLGLDLSEGAIVQARERAKGMSANINYAVADLNAYDWEPDRYDLVIANGALHHIKNLEGVLSGIKKTLRPGGLLYACEYVGPSYMDHSFRQLELINASSFMMPPELRARKPVNIENDRLFRLLSKAWEIAARRERDFWKPWQRAVSRSAKWLLRRNPNRLDFGVVYRSPKQFLIRTDPSECVRSGELLGLVRTYFPRAEIRPFGGGLLQHALDQNFYDNFDADNPKHATLLQLLIDLESNLMRIGEIGPENAYIFVDTAKT